MLKKQIDAVFEMLGISTDDERGGFDFNSDTPEPASDKEVTFIRVENESCLEQGASNAELESDSRRD